MRTVFALLLLLAIPRPALADFMAAEAAERRGEHSEAYQACKSEVDAGDAECQNLVGYLFQEGLGVPANATEAIRLFRLAAKRGLAMAQCQLGLAYARGLGVSPDDVEAVRWYQWRRHKEIRLENIFSRCRWRRDAGLPRIGQRLRTAAPRGRSRLCGRPDRARVSTRSGSRSGATTSSSLYVVPHSGPHDEQPKAAGPRDPRAKIGSLSNSPRSRSSLRAIPPTTGSLSARDWSSAH